MRPPLLLLPFSLANLATLFGVPLATSILPVSKFNLSVEELIILFGVFLLSVELWRATVPTPRTMLHHAVNLGLMLAAIFEAATLPSARTGLFLVLIALVGADLVLGTYLTLVTKGQNVWISNNN